MTEAVSETGSTAANLLKATQELSGQELILRKAVDEFLKKINAV